MPANVDRILERHEDMKTARVNWDSHYDEVADLVRPEISFNSERTPGEKRRFQIYDDTAVNAHAELAANLDATLTNSQIRWLELVPADPTVDLEDDETQRWLYAATSIMLRHFENSESGFATAIHEVFLDLGSWGTAAMTVKEKPTGPRFSARPLSACFIDGDDDGDQSGERPPFETLTTFFLAGQRLQKNPLDADGLEQLLQATEVAEPTRPPYGVDIRLWQRTCELADELADALVDGDEPDHDAAVAVAAELHDLLRPYI